MVNSDLIVSAAAAQVTLTVNLNRTLPTMWSVQGMRDAEQD